MDLTHVDGPTRSRGALLAALAIGLVASVPLWWLSGGIYMTVREAERWVRVVGLSALAMLTVGVVLWRREATHEYRSGIVAGTAWALLADATWWSLAASTAGD